MLSCMILLTYMLCSNENSQCIKTSLVVNVEAIKVITQDNNRETIVWLKDKETLKVLETPAQVRRKINKQCKEN